MKINMKFMLYYCILNYNNTNTMAYIVCLQGKNQHIINRMFDHTPFFCKSFLEKFIRHNKISFIPIKFWFYHHTLHTYSLLLQCGDVHPNPGPNFFKRMISSLPNSMKEIYHKYFISNYISLQP